MIKLNPVQSKVRVHINLSSGDRINTTEKLITTIDEYKNEIYRMIQVGGLQRIGNMIIDTYYIVYVRIETETEMHNREKTSILKKEWMKKIIRHAPIVIACCYLLLMILCILNNLF